MNATNLALLWIGPTHRDDEAAEAFASMLADNCCWHLDDFDGQNPWDAPIPPVSEWENEIAKFNEHLRTM